MSIRYSTVDFVAVLLVVAASGNPITAHLLTKEGAIIGLPMLLATYAFIKGHFLLRRSDLAPFAVFSAIGLLHVLQFGVLVAPATIGFALKVSAALMAVRVIPNFWDNYVRVMSALAALSLIFFLPQAVLGDTFRQLVAPMAIDYGPPVIHLGIHNLGPEIHSYRNSGFFWEPGAFAGYLCVAIVFHAIRRTIGQRKIVDWRIVILLGALLSTQSTTGYVAILFFAGALFVARYGLRHLGRLLISFSAVAIIGAVAYLNVPFLAEKVEAQVQSAASGDELSEINRFGNALYDWEFIQLRPLIGWSPYTDVRAAIDSDVAEVVAGQGNGLTGFIVRFGFVGLVAYLLFVLRSLRSAGVGFLIAISSVATLALLLVGEQYLNFPLFLAMMFNPCRSAAMAWQQLPSWKRETQLRSLA